MHRLVEVPAAFEFGGVKPGACVPGLIGFGPGDIARPGNMRRAMARQAKPSARSALSSSRAGARRSPLASGLRRDVMIADPLALLCARAGGPLTAAEWKTVAPGIPLKQTCS